VKRVTKEKMERNSVHSGKGDVCAYHMRVYVCCIFMSNVSDISPMRAFSLTSRVSAEILKLKVAKSSGWMSEEEFDTEVKRLIREHNGEVATRSERTRETEPLGEQAGENRIRVYILHCVSEY